jgi:hypothetical protein
MTEGTDDDDLREAARNRGLRLIKSRKRKAGVGDYGKFGLADQKGNALYGVDPDGTLTASAQDVAGYLRKGDASTWAESARVMPAEMILSDVRLTSGTGPLAVQAIIAEHGDIPVIFITDTPEDCAPCAPPGVILGKPIIEHALKDTFRRLAPKLM